MVCALLLASLLPPVAAAPDPDPLHLRVPAGHALVGRAADGEFAFSVVPAEAQALNEGPIECDNDVFSAPLLPSLAALTLNPYASLQENRASEAECDGTPDGPATYAGPVTVLRFRTAGDRGGALYVEATDVYGLAARLSIDCARAEQETAAGVGPLYADPDDLVGAAPPEGDASDCVVRTEGSPPSDYRSFRGWLYNWNRYSGTTYGGAVTGAEVR